MKKKNIERILAGFILIGFLIVFSAVGGMETNTLGLTDGVLVSLVGFIVLAIVIFIGNRREN